MSHRNITPTTKLTSEQRRVALERLVQKKEPLRKEIPPNMSQLSNNNLAGGIAQRQVEVQTPPPPRRLERLSPVEQPPALDTSQMPLQQSYKEGVKEELTPAEEQIQSALIADQIWRDSGGNESIGAEVWKNLKEKSKEKHLDTPRDYFISCFVKWRRDPEKFAKSHPNEASLIRKLSNEFEAAVPSPEEELQLEEGPVDVPIPMDAESQIEGPMDVPIPTDMEVPQ